MCKFSVLKAPGVMFHGGGGPLRTLPHKAAGVGSPELG